MKHAIALSLLVLGVFQAWCQKDPYLIVGTYTSGKSEGIYVYQFNTSTGEDKLMGGIKSVNPSFLAISPDEKTVYAVNETNNSSGNGGTVTSYMFNKSTGTLTEIGKQPSAGNDPCYITTDKSGRWVIVGNYSSGTVSVYAVKSDGSLSEANQVIPHTGTGPNLERQQSPHVHATVFSKDDKFLLAPDLGIDKVMVYPFDKDKGILSVANASFASANPGGGPRHLDFHPNNSFVYVIEELTGVVDVFA
ncbi:MAG: lactonase family protein, partial [Cytophagales bacterium]|nr:lactonase family protein [Cytophagales bacterium]